MASLSPAGWRKRVGHAHKIESEQYAVAVRHVADDPAHRQRELSDERRSGNNLLALGQERLLVDVDHFEIVPALEVLVAYRPKVVHGAERSRRQPRDVQTKDVPTWRHDGMVIVAHGDPVLRAHAPCST